ncbi:DMT family transporter [Verrucomicrobiota bacterium]
MAIAACLLWATPFAVIKLALEHMDPLSMAGIRFIIAGLIQLPLCGSLIRPFRLLRTNLKTVLLVSLFQTILLYAGFFIAMTLVRGAQAAILIGTGPLISAIVAHFAMHDDKLSRRTLISTGLGICGVAMISLATKPWTPVGAEELLGMGILLLGSVVSAFGNVVVARQRGGVNAIHLNCIQMLIGGGALLLIALPVEGIPNLKLPPMFYAQMLWLAIVSAAGFGIWFQLLSKLKVSKLNIWKFLIPVGGAALSWAILPDESPDWLTLTGMAIIVCGVYIGQQRR